MDLTEEITTLEKTINLLPNLSKIKDAYKVLEHIKFMKVKNERPDLNQKQICESLNRSVSTIQRVRKDLAITSPYKYDIPLKKSTKTPSIKCSHCDFLARTTAGLESHNRSFHHRDTGGEQKVSAHKGTTEVSTQRKKSPRGMSNTFKKVLENNSDTIAGGTKKYEISEEEFDRILEPIQP